MTKSLSFKFRPHHSLCVQFFEGKGYSDEFVCGMAKIVAVLENDNASLTLTGGCDEICSSCPNRDNGSCDVTGKASCYDKRCLDLLGMKIGDTADWKELSRIARENIILKDRLSQVCGDCKWSHICRDKADKMKSLH